MFVVVWVLRTHAVHMVAVNSKILHSEKRNLNIFLSIEACMLYVANPNNWGLYIEKKPIIQLPQEMPAGTTLGDTVEGERSQDGLRSA